MSEKRPRGFDPEAETSPEKEANVVPAEKQPDDITQKTVKSTEYSRSEIAGAVRSYLEGMEVSQTVAKRLEELLESVLARLTPGEQEQFRENFQGQVKELKEQGNRPSVIVETLIANLESVLKNLGAK